MNRVTMSKDEAFILLHQMQVRIMLSGRPATFADVEEYIRLMTLIYGTPDTISLTIKTEAQAKELGLPGPGVYRALPEGLERTDEFGNSQTIPINNKEQP